MCVYCYIYCLASVVQRSQNNLRPLESSLLIRIKVLILWTLLIGIKVWDLWTLSIGIKLLGKGLTAQIIYRTSKCHGRYQWCCLCTEG